MFTNETVVRYLIDDRRNEMRMTHRPRPRPPVSIRHWVRSHRRGR